MLAERAEIFLSTRLVCLTKDGKAEKSAIEPICCGRITALKVLISDQLESCQTLTLKAVKMKLELFDNDDKLKELEV